MGEGKLDLYLGGISRQCFNASVFQDVRMNAHPYESVTCTVCDIMAGEIQSSESARIATMRYRLDRHILYLVYLNVSMTRPCYKASIQCSFYWGGGISALVKCSHLKQNVLTITIHIQTGISQCYHDKAMHATRRQFSFNFVGVWKW